MSRFGRRLRDSFLEGILIVAMIAGAALGLVVCSWIVYIVVEWLMGAIR